MMTDDVDRMMSDLVAQNSMEPVDRTCPDDGKCHHSCQPQSPCWRTKYCGPLSGVFPGDRWPT